MYTRIIQGPRDTPFENGWPLAGTWTQPFTDVNLLDIKKPYFLQYPKWMLNYRIKEWQSFTVNHEQFYIDVTLSYIKKFRAVHVFFYDNKNNEHICIQKALHFSKWQIPHSLKNSTINDHNSGLFLKIHYWLDIGIIKMDINIEEGKKWPAFTLHVEYEIRKITPMVVNLLFSETRSMYAYKACAQVTGDMIIGRQRTIFNTALSSGIFCDYKGYYPINMKSKWCNALYVDSKKRIGFTVVENQAKETYKNNENGLWVDGRFTALPPVHITTPNGINGEWIIQDMEGMVDLVFTPQVPAQKYFDLTILEFRYGLLFGTYKGVLVDSEGSQIIIHNILGSSRSS